MDRFMIQVQFWAVVALFAGSMTVSCTFIEPYIEEFDSIPLQMSLGASASQVVLPQMGSDNVPLPGQTPLEPKTGVDFVFSLNIANRNPSRAILAGVEYELRIGDTALSRAPLVVVVAPLDIDAGKVQSVQLRFELRLDNPYLSESLWPQVASAESVPLRLIVTIPYILAVESLVAPGVVDTVGIDTLRADFPMVGTQSRPAQASIDLLQGLIAQLL